MEDPDAEIEALAKEKKEREPQFSQNLLFEESVDEEQGLLDQA